MSQFNVYVSDSAVKRSFEENVKNGIYQDHHILETVKLLIRQLQDRNPASIVEVFDYVHPKYRRYYGVGKRKTGFLK